ncbi:ATPase AAA domain-containing protein 2B [Chytriomyces hyalinus]|nr:ATPase AAA domain-containing protein 2B [Chytriomyces hyalinus]
MMQVELQFSGGMELLFDNQRSIKAQLPDAVTTMRHLIAHTKETYLKERPELFVQGDTVRAGILVLINDADWELEGELEYELQPRDVIVFITLWRCFETTHLDCWAMIGPAHSEANIEMDTERDADAYLAAGHLGVEQPVAPDSNPNAARQREDYEPSSYEIDEHKRRKLNHEAILLDDIFPEPILAPIIASTKFQAPPGHASLSNEDLQVGVGSNAKYSLRTRREKPAPIYVPEYNTRTRSSRDSFERNASPPPRQRDRDRSFHAKIEGMSGHRPETRGVRTSYIEPTSDDEEFQSYVPSARPRSSRQLASASAYQTDRPSSAESISARRSTRRNSELREEDDINFDGRLRRRSSRGSSVPVEDSHFPVRAAKNARRLSESSEDHMKNEGAGMGADGDSNAAVVSANKPYPKKISLKFKSNSNEDVTQGEDEALGENNEPTGVAPSTKNTRRRRIEDNDEEDEDVDEYADSLKDVDFQLEDGNAESEDEFNSDNEDAPTRGRRKAPRVYSDKPRYNSHPSAIEDGYSNGGRNLRSRSGGDPQRHRNNANGVTDDAFAQEKEAQKKLREEAKLSRERRLRLRRARNDGFEELEDLDLLNTDLDHDGDDEFDSSGRPRRRLRPRGEKVDYSRQLHPGAGWNGQPIGAIQSDRTRSRFNNRGGGNGFGRSGGGGRNPDERAFSYKPGRYGRDANPLDSSDDDGNGNANIDRSNARRQGGDRTVNRGNNIEPINIMEIMRAQEHAIMKDLPEEERKKYEQNARLFRKNGGKDLADTDPVSTSTINFDSIGGLEDHIRSLKEMVVMPLLYPEIFSGFQISAPRGVLFHGPPGTGKTLMARALASSCSTSTQKVAFFMRKGADVLSKWVGESERQLRLLFEEAKTYQPSIIFFDEIDGLAPVRSSKQDQIHASIVSTLLALMDGLDSRGQVVVIGATNRIDAIDPALRRPGRFDRELYFPLPTEPARKKIISITTSKWNPPVSEKLLDDLAKSTRGYCGADVRALCTEAALNAVQRSFPEIYESSHKLEISTSDIIVTAEDFSKSMKRIIPSTQRTSTVYSSPIPVHLKPLVQSPFIEITKTLDVLCPMLKQVAEANVSGFMADSQVGNSGPGPLQQLSNSYLSYAFSFQPRLLICGEAGMGQRLLGPAALEVLESQKVYIQSLDLSTLLNDSSRTVDAAIIQLFHEMKRHRPAVLFIPDIDIWWETLSEAAQFVFVSLIERDPMNPVMILATCEALFQELKPELQGLIQGRLGSFSGIEGWKRVIVATKPDQDARKQFFNELIESVKKPPALRTSNPAKLRRKKPLKRAPSPPPRELTEEEAHALFEHDETLRRQLRLELRFIVTDLKRNKKFNDFLRPVDPDAFPDYYETVRDPMDLETLLWKINDRQYAVLDDFIDDFECIVNSAEEYNEPGSAIVAKAYDLLDTFMMYINTLQKNEPQFLWELKQSCMRCNLVNEQRRRRGADILGKSRDAALARRKAELDKLNENAALKRSDFDSNGDNGGMEAEDDGRNTPVGMKDDAGVSSPPSVAKRVIRIIASDDEDDEADAQPTSIKPDEKKLALSDESDKSNMVVDPHHVDKSADDGSNENDVRETVVVADLEENGEAADIDPLQNLFQDEMEAQPEVKGQEEPVIENVVEPVVDTAIVMTEEKSDSEMEVEEPLPDFIVNENALENLANDLVYRTEDWSVSDLEGLGVALCGAVFRNSASWDRAEMIQELCSVLDKAEEAWKVKV